MNEKIGKFLTGAIVAVISVSLVLLGNPGNMGICVACFIRDIAGATHLHTAPVVQYLRPEIIGIILGATIASIGRKEFLVKGGSSPITRFFLGFGIMIGALIFLGCPTRMALRIAGGDLNAVVGLVGFIVGILIGIFFLNKGFTLKRTHDVAKADGYLFPLSIIILFIIFIFFPSVLAFSKEGPGSLHAPVIISLVAGLVVGIVGFISRLCFAGGIRDSFLFKNLSSVIPFVTIIVVATILNLIFNKFNLGFENQPIAHTDGLWNFLGMVLVGLGSVLLGGCPFRQLILAGSGNSDSVITVIGMLMGAAFAHNFKMASSAEGPTANGKIGFAIFFALMLFIAIYNTFIREEE